MEQRLEIDCLFSSHMVLQREKPIKLWGKCSGKESVTVTFMGNTVTADIEKNTWAAVLPPQEAARNQKLMVRSGEEGIYLSDIHVGEVWIAGGQSNMEFYLRYDADYRAYKAAESAKNSENCGSTEIEKCEKYENNDIRFYDVPEICYKGQEEDFDYSEMGIWRTCTNENLNYYSAVGYYFARKLQKELQVPIGIIGCNKGGSCTQTWMSREALKKHGRVWLDAFEEEIRGINYPAYCEAMRKDPHMNMGKPFEDKFTEETLYGIGAERQRELMEKMAEQQAESSLPMIHYDNRPGCYYDNMLLKIGGVSTRGVIWYQGESEVFHPECYYEIFQDMIQCWRDLWKEKLPFHCVQLAPFQNWMDCYGIDFPVIRRIQENAVQHMEKVHLVSSSDAGMRYDIHPKKKQPIGYRLALSALKYDYGKAVQADAPRGISVKTVGSDLHIGFAGDMENLKVCGDEIRELQLFAKGFGGQAADGAVLTEEREVSYDRKDFYIEGTTLVLRNTNVGGKRISRVSFAQKDYYEVNLYGSNGLPAMPFECEIKNAD